ncbi:hypothetical protein [Formosa haliotis]|uniref:hypothetical protein n=1 Tax=Formosa haliotis TaxID=1555194 RepID=UPI00082712B7|nr:hypothetical protein [Formosa haliotis]
MKKSLITTLLFGTLAVLLFQACQDDPEFPDPGFELTDQRVEVRRDTVDFYNVHMTMKVPNKVEHIEVLDGLDYELLETINEYDGQTNFDFDYLVDLTEIDTDSVLNYIIKVTDQDNRSFNRGIRISVKGFSYPEIDLVGGTEVAVAAPAYSVKGTISTGLNTIESVRVVFEDEVQYSYDVISGEELHEMDINAIVFLGNLDPNLLYPIDIIIEDSAGQVSTTTVNVRKSDTLSRPYRILYKNTSDIQNTIDFVYDEEDRMIEFKLEYPTGTTYIAAFDYNDLDMVAVYTYSAFGSDGIISSQTVFNFNYIEGTKQLIDIDRQRFEYDDAGDLASETEITKEASEFVYEGASSKVLSFRRTSTCSDIYYSDPFDLGENIYGEYFQYSSYMGSNTIRRQHREDYDPVLIPTYIEGLPPYTDTSNTALLDVFQDILYNKYMMTKTVSTDPAYTATYLAKPSYSYETDSEGRISLISSLNTEGSFTTVGKTRTYAFFYND